MLDNDCFNISCACVQRQIMVINGKQGLGRDLPTVKAAAAAATAGDDSSEISDMTALKQQQLEDNDNNRPTTAQTGTDVSNDQHFYN
jgi:hypothetical protein